MPPPLPDEVRELFAGPNFGHLATVRRDGSPHTVAVWVGVEGGHVYFFTQPGSRKARNLARDPRVAISVVDGRTGEPFPMRSGVVYLIEVEQAGHRVLPFDHRPPG